MSGLLISDSCRDSRGFHGFEKKCIKTQLFLHKTSVKQISTGT